jgi:HlyD family secretion protein
MKTLVKITSYTLLVILLSCNSGDNVNEASGVFEATEIIVSAETSGNLLSFSIEEGDDISKGQIVGQIDSTQLHLQKLQVMANQKAVLSNQPNIKSQLLAIQKEIESAEIDKARIENLLKGDVATQKQLDDINARLAVLYANLDAKKRSLSISTEAIDAQSAAMDVQIISIEDQLAKSTIKSPLEGTVLVKYAEESELTGTGKPLFKIADLSNMILVAYLTSDQLSNISIGQKVKVYAEYGEEGNKEYDGTITWISSKSEFTPKTVQTQNERANLVYAVKISVPNDGFIKIGMYGGIRIGE